jgi:hypothetical protein
MSSSDSTVAAIKEKLAEAKFKHRKISTAYHSAVCKGHSTVCLHEDKVNESQKVIDDLKRQLDEAEYHTSKRRKLASEVVLPSSSKSSESHEKVQSSAKSSGSHEKLQSSAKSSGSKDTRASVVPPEAKTALARSFWTPEPCAVKSTVSSANATPPDSNVVKALESKVQLLQSQLDASNVVKNQRKGPDLSHQLLVKVLQENKSMASICERLKAKIEEMKLDAAKFAEYKAKASAKFKEKIKQTEDLEQKVKALTSENLSLTGKLATITQERDDLEDLAASAQALEAELEVLRIFAPDVATRIQ